ncbi:MAG: hypothetical protein P9L93_01870 [Candidatus Gorgyraea atricola]|nr:hypothetical protein [Candidatus Gorgyraea atricola]
MRKFRKRYNFRLRVNIALVFMTIAILAYQSFAYALRIPMMSTFNLRENVNSLDFARVIMISSGLEVKYDPYFEVNRLRERILEGENIDTMSELSGYEYGLGALVRLGKLRRYIYVKGSVTGDGDYYHISIDSKALPRKRLSYIYDSFAKVESYPHPDTECKTKLSFSILKDKEVHEFYTEIAGEILLGADFTSIYQNRATLVLKEEALRQLLKALKQKDLIETKEAHQAEKDGRLVLSLKVSEPIIDILFLVSIFVGEINIRKPFELVIFSETNTDTKEIFERQKTLFAKKISKKQTEQIVEEVVIPEIQVRKGM